MNGNYEAMKFLAEERVEARLAEAELHRQARAGGARPLLAVVAATGRLAFKLAQVPLRAILWLTRHGRPATRPLTDSPPRFEH